MSDDLAASVQLCFALYDLACQTDLNRKDVLEVAKLSGVFQPVLLRLQKAVLQSDAVAADEQLQAAIGAVYSALQDLQQAACRCRVPHWLLRVLAARDIRQQLSAAFKAAAAALQQLAAAAEADVVAAHFPDSYLAQLQQLQQLLAAHKVHRHEPLEGLARGLLRHMSDERTDAQALPSMLKFVVKEAAAQTQLKPTHHDDGSSSRGASSSSSNGASSSKAAAAADGASSSSSRSGRDAASLPPGETSLTDSQLLSELLQLAGSKTDEEQAALYQVVSILEGLHDAKRQQQREHMHRRYQRRHQQQQQQQQGHLQRVSEADDDRTEEGANNGTITASDTSNPAAAGQAGRAGQAGPDSALRERAGDRNNNCYSGEVSDGSGDSGGGSGQPVDEASRQLKEVVNAMMGQLEDMLWMDPWDAAALMQIMELLLQVEDAAEQQQQGDEDDDSQDYQQQQQSRQGILAPLRSRQQQQQQGNEQEEDVQQQADQQSKDHSRNRKGKWWQVGAVAKAAMKSRTAASSNSSTATSQQQQSAAAAAAAAAEQQQQAAWRERIHALAAGSLDVLLHLTPRPAGSSSSSSSSSDTFLKTVSRDGVCTEAGHSLALPLMSHADTVPALAACLWSGRTWPDVGLKAAQLLAILIDSGTAVVAAGGGSAADAPAATYAAFCKKICSSGNSTSCGAECAASGSRSSIWYGFVHMLHSSSHPAAGAAAEALAAVGRSRAMVDLCSSLAAAQQARALLLLLSRYQLHNGAGGAAAAAMNALSDVSLRPAMHSILANSFWELVPGAAESLGALLLQLLVGNDALAAARAAELAASLVGDVGWGGKGNTWLDMFKAGQRLLALRGGRSRGSGSISGCGSVSSSRSRACGAALLAQLVGENFGAATAAQGLDKAELEALHQQQHMPPMLAADIDVGERDDLLFEALQMCVQQFSLSGSWEGMDCALDSSSSRCSQQLNEGLAAVQLLGALLSWLPVEGVACAMPELHAVVLPVLEHLAATQGGLLRREARRVQELLLGLGQ